MEAMDTSCEVAIIGGGIAGAACALRAAQYNLPFAWILGDRSTEKGSRGRWVRNIDNMIGVHPGIGSRVDEGVCHAQAAVVGLGDLGDHGC